MVDPEDYAHRTWMPGRVPKRDALVMVIPQGVDLADVPLPDSHEQRWSTLPDGRLKLMIVHDGSPHDETLFNVEPDAWDHTTCDACKVRIEAMALRYVTCDDDPYLELCEPCYAQHVADHLSGLRRLVWSVKKLLGIVAAA